MVSILENTNFWEVYPFTHEIENQRLTLDGGVLDDEFTSFHFVNCEIINGSFSASKFVNCTFQNVTFSNIVLDFVTFKNCQFNDVKFIACSSDHLRIA